MFVDKDIVENDDFLVMMYLLNSGQQTRMGHRIEDIRSEISKVIAPDAFDRSVEKLMDSFLVNSFKSGGPARFVIEDGADNFIGLTFSGFAFLINYVGEYLPRIEQQYGELPEILMATLIPYLELRSVPAADRYVSATDNREAFQSLTENLEVIRLEIVKDLNRGELPIKQKRGFISELDGMLAQLRSGFIRLSDLTTRVRPMIRGLAETCKDFTIIAGAASAAYLAISQILGKLF